MFGSFYPPDLANASAQEHEEVQREEEEEEHDSPWEPETLPAAVPCILTTKYKGKPVLGTAVVDDQMPSELPLPLELVPPEEASAAPKMLKKGGYFIFSDAYVHKYPQSNVAALMRQFSQLRSGNSSCTGMDFEPNADGSSTTTLGTVGGITPSAGNSIVSSTQSLTGATRSLTAAPKNKTDEVRECIRDVWATSRPLFRPRKPTSVYGQANYAKRNFHTIMDDEYPIEYII